jgi:ubiquinone/menaquinone biosynthesis C-methylase UbiE
MNIGIGDPTYWDLRYKTEKEKALQFELFDWYLPFELVFPMLESTIELTGKQKILVVGVGRSNIIKVLYELGYRDITAIDVSPTVITQMQDTHTQCAGVDFLVMDVMELNSFADSSFSLVIDKGCIDALFCRTDFESCASRSFREIFRVLKKETGIFASISHAPPLTRVAYMRQAAKWSIDATPLLDGEHITLYTLLRTTNEVLLARRIDGKIFIYNIYNIV